MLQNITTGLLTGDNVLPKNEDVLQGLVAYALTDVATRADSLHLMTLSTTADVLRLAQGDYLIRRPNTPEDGVDELDIDSELGFAVARIVASMLSKEKGGIHANEATRIILNYNAKVYEITEQMANEATNEGLPSDGSTNYVYPEGTPSTEWSL